MSSYTMKIEAKHVECLDLPHLKSVLCYVFHDSPVFVQMRSSHWLMVRLQNSLHFFITPIGVAFNSFGGHASDWLKIIILRDGVQ